MSGLDEKDEMREEVRKDPDAYEGCPLCFGRGELGYTIARYDCPKCKGRGIVKKEERGLFETWAK